MSRNEKPPNDPESKIIPFFGGNKSAFSETLSYSESERGSRKDMSENSNDPLSEIHVAEVVDDQVQRVDLAQPLPTHQVVQSSLGWRETGSSMSSDSPLAYTAPPPIPEDMDNVAAVGGAVGALALGIWSIVGSFITPWSIVNSGLGILLGFWGITSRHRQWALFGMVLCVIGFVLTTIQINELIQYFFRAQEAVETERMGI